MQRMTSAALRSCRLAWRVRGQCGSASAPQLPPFRAGSPCRGLVSTCASASESFGGGTAKTANRAKARTQFVCQECGAVFLQSKGRCPACQEWNCVVEEAVPDAGGGAAGGGRPVGVPGRKSGAWVAPSGGSPKSLKEARGGDGGRERGPRVQLTGVGAGELRRVLGGGLVPGSLTLVSGDPGVGKSTLMLQVAGLLAKGLDVEVEGEVEGGSTEDGRGMVLYVSGEESVGQLAGRAERLGIESESLRLYTQTDVDEILGTFSRESPRAMVVDSIQTVFSRDLTSGAGSVAQVRECTTRLLHAAKGSGCPVLLVGHVTKSGDIAGPRVLEHIVDTVLFLEGERFQQHRVLRSVKNRFGSTDEVGVFQMGEKGLVDVRNPSALFMTAEDGTSPAAAAVAVTVEGSRPLLAEVQALTSPTQIPVPRRNAVGVDLNRRHLLLAVLSRAVHPPGGKAGQHKRPTMAGLAEQDVFVNVVGGLKLQEPATDLAVVMSVASSFFGCAVRPGTAFAGEVGLGGELRAVPQVSRRVAEAESLGFTSAVVPKGALKGEDDKQGATRTIRVDECATVYESLLAGLQGFDGKNRPAAAKGRSRRRRSGNGDEGDDGEDDDGW